MRLEEVAKLSPIKRLAYWIQERHNIYLRRKSGKNFPWTDDEVLRTYFFTNPFRENDKVTKWFREWIRDPLKDHPAVVLATIAFRWFNLPATGAALMDERRNLWVDWDCAEVVRILTERKAAGHHVFTGAFNISSSGSKKAKVNRVCEDYLQPVWEDIANLYDGLSGANLRDAHALLSRYPGLGGSGFMAAQVVCDLKYTHVLDKAKDWRTWCSPGPGSKKGLNIILGRDPEGPAPKNFLEEMNKLRESLAKLMPRFPLMHTQDVQNCCCEFFKYERARQGGGSKRRYKGGAFYAEPR
jgi:hypothetical protein